MRALLAITGGGLLGMYLAPCLIAHDTLCVNP